MRLIKDISWNAVSYIIPMIVAIPALGVIARHISVECFGFFMLIYTILGYASIFDFGFTRALVRCIARVKYNVVEVKEYLLTSVISVFTLSLIPMLILFLSPGTIISLLKVNSENVSDFIFCLKISAICFPFLMVFLILTSYYEGSERFRELSLIKLITSVCLSIIPMILTYMTSNITYAVIGVLIARFVSLTYIAILIYQEIKNVKANLFCQTKLKSLIRYGSWLTLTNIISPLLTSVDRFVLSSISGAGNLALYTAPSEIINRFLILPGIISKTLFPKFARENNQKLQNKVFLFVFLGMFIICCILFYLGDLIISIWLGMGYSKAILPFKILCIGLFFCGIAQLPYMVIQAKGFSKTAAIIHSIEVVPYLLLLYILTIKYQFVGAAIAWTVRVSVDSILFMLMERLFIRRQGIING